MTIALYITLAVIFLLMLFIIWETIHHRRKISIMTGMMISMSLGMIVGLTVGVILGVLLLGELFLSTMIAMLVGIIAGFFAGLPLGLIPVLDGTLAGIMGGMMGAMLGEMIALEHQDAVIRIIFLLFIGTIIIIYQIMQSEFIKSKKLLNDPFVMLILFVVFIIVYNQMGPLLPLSYSSNIAFLVMV